MNSSNRKTQESEKKFYLIIRQEDLDFLDGNHCAAALMSVFRNTHKWKLETDQRNKKTNDIAQQHGDARWLPEDVLINFTIPELLERILHLFGRNAVMDALKFLEDKGAISIDTTPNQKYKYDQGRYFRFHPEAHSKWLREQEQKELFNETEELEIIEEFSLPESQDVENRDGLKLNHAKFENKLDSSTLFKNKLTQSENKHTPFKNKLCIDINNKINNKIKNQSIKSGNNFSNVEKISFGEKNKNEVSSIIDALIAKGMPPQRFYPDAIDKIHKLQQSGVTEKIFLDAYDICVRCKRGESFGVNYLAKAVEDLLSKSNKPKFEKTTPTPVTAKIPSNCIYENDLTKGLHWIDGDE